MRLWPYLCLIVTLPVFATDPLGSAEESAELEQGVTSSIYEEPGQIDEKTRNAAVEAPEILQPPPINPDDELIKSIPSGWEEPVLKPEPKKTAN